MPRKPAEIVDRDLQWKELTDRSNSPSPELIFGVGRRRAGKSWVLARFAKAANGIYYQATRRTETEQLSALTRIVGQHFRDPVLIRGGMLPDWESLFQYMVDRAAGKPLLLILDEFPYLADAVPALTSIIQTAWDHQWTGTRMKLVLNGSHISAMRRLEEADQPLYGRRTGRLLFPPFAPSDAAAFMRAYAPREQLMTFAIFGGLPGHLVLLNDTQTLGENVARLMLNPSGRLFDEAQHMLDAFLTDADIHYSIIQAIANGERTWSKITSRLGKSSGSLSRPMRWLEAMEIVARVVPVTESNPRTSKRALYRVSDPYVAFWHRFVAPLIVTGDINIARPDQLWQQSVIPNLDDYMGSPFEEMCRSWVARSAGLEVKRNIRSRTKRGAAGGTRLPFTPNRVGAWWDASSQNEVDIVALGPGGHILVGECKWGEVSDDDLELLRRRAKLVIEDLDGHYVVKHVHFAVFSARGLWGARVAAAISDGSVIGLTAEDILGGV
jgi:AAA+ ATPase superfamily predicted ATPase